MHLFNKILVANRGEIAVRIIRAVQSMGIKAVAIYSDADEFSLHVRMADEARSLGGNDLADTYLDINKIVNIASASGCEAIHPGYGFLAENPAFVKACDKVGIVFIGPNARAMKLMGNKIESREALKNANIPMTAGITGETKTLLKRAKEIPFPILVKAAAGGGGKGMRIVHDPSALEEVLESTSREARSYFGDGTVFLEKFIEEPRHIEIQVLGDNYGNVIHLFERECSIQRRYQKIIEESPSPTLTPEIRQKMGETAVRIAKEIGYNNAGTVEFLVDKNLNFYFLEMNTRVQVEHPVTELVTGIDIVREQIQIAAGKKLDIEQDSIRQNGHAIECRIYAEDPENSFLPSPGDMTLYNEPAGEGIRLDTGLDDSVTIHSFYDPLISKVIVWGENREVAREKMIGALEGYIIHGIRTNITFLRYLMGHRAYISNSISTKYIDEHIDKLINAIRKEKSIVSWHYPAIAYYLHEFNKGRLIHLGEEANAWRDIGYWREIIELSGIFDGNPFSVEVEKVRGGKYFIKIGEDGYVCRIKGLCDGLVEAEIGDRQYVFYISTAKNGTGYVSFQGFIFEIIRNDVLAGNGDMPAGAKAGGGRQDGKIVSPMPGKVIKVNVKQGEKVKKGVTLLIVEAMKMENHIVAPIDGLVESIHVKTGDMVSGSVQLIHLKNISNQE